MAVTPSTNGFHRTGTVMLCYDGSKESANAIARAGELLTTKRAVVVHVWAGISSLMLSAPLAGPPSGAIAEGASLLDEADRARAEKSAAEGVELAEAAGFDARPEAEHKDRNVWWTLRQYAEQHEISAIVVGARGRSRMASALLGSVSSGLVHHACAPLLVVPATATGRGEGPVMFCDDASDNAREAIRRGRALLRGPGLVASLWHSWVVNVPYMVVGAGAAAGMAQDIDEAAEEQTQTTAADGAGRAGDECESACVRFDGPSWRGLLNTANDRDATVVVVGSRGLTGIAGALGSVSAAIAHHSPRPVLIVPPAGESPTEEYA
jgi:nucleotide-binding universal stress UspA family protein